MTTPQAAPLLPCPFCGKADISGDEVLGERPGNMQYRQAMCRNCGALGPESRDERGAPEDAWNRRASGTPVVVPAQPVAERRGSCDGDAWAWFGPAYGNAPLGTKLYAAAAPAPAPTHQDDVAVDKFAAAMKAKLAKKRGDGRGGWDDPGQCSVACLCELLINHCSKANSALDIANLAMMIWHRTDGQDHSYIPAANLAARLEWIDKRGRPIDSPPADHRQHAHGGPPMTLRECIDAEEPAK